ncbi:hypothetical protein EB75_21475 [Mycobacterium sp. ST-F2]|uniref:hypothetical protein n=1 Tax=Mycobacterium sp. ST-F2 TaxID=1490484 RepID=UPI00093C4D3D|nr:hypothetical protein [Mycobacterium sp. ST-F2]OKH80031.1 hypothetical protein EB75_21475 [Mycobacterium sp. ST-F2]
MRTSLRHPRTIGLAAFMGAMAFGGAPLAASDPTPGSQTADIILQELSSDGYTVSINWVSGLSSLPLNRCQVSAIHNPNRGVPVASPRF